MHRLIISFYDYFGAAHDAVKELIEKGFRPNSVSLIAHKAVCDRIWTGDRSKSWFFLSQPCSFQLAGIGEIMVSGFFSNDFMVNDAGSKSLVRVLEKHFIPRTDAHAYTEGVRRKGILVVVRAENTNSNKALSILDRYCPVDIQDLEARWRKAGWTHFDDSARPLANHGFTWPNCITSLPGDALLIDDAVDNWPQSIVNPRKKRN